MKTAEHFLFLIRIEADSIVNDFFLSKAHVDMTALSPNQTSVVTSALINLPQSKNLPPVAGLPDLGQAANPYVWLITIVIQDLAATCSIGNPEIASLLVALGQNLPAVLSATGPALQFVEKEIVVAAQKIETGCGCKSCAAS